LKTILDAQHQHWQDTFNRNPEMFGAEPSAVARFAMELFKKEGKTRIIELGAGQGRDTFFFAQNGLQVYTLDYSESAVAAITGKARELHLSDAITARQHDVRLPLPFDDESFDACYSHMLYCMALTTPELEFLSREVKRILRPEGLQVYTVRHTGDAHYGTGSPRGEDMYEVGGFIVHFFSRKKVEHLAAGYTIIAVDEFEEGALPRKLFRVTLKKKAGG